MPVVKHCLSCNKPLAGYRSHAVTCGSTCRGRQWRANKEVVVPVKLAFSVKHFEAIRTAADKHGVTVASYIISRSIGSDIATIISV
ncbi:hypothetical protein PS645_01475 [Pseudomonas fluorescens]|uniref:Uncharacterized protein n=1 Tax=Pseudomonas fluorescens TaxID=294 RepID=A0A5E6RAN6_PSEFL|nr:hypothetical protein PS645_01475 [Pseudomonas fluorescens]